MPEEQPGPDRHEHNEPAEPVEPDTSREPAEAEEPDGGRRRLWQALVAPSRAQVAVAVLLALVGFAAVTQVRTNQVDHTYAGMRQQDLIDVLNGLADTTQRAQAEIQRLEQTRDDLQSDTNARQAALEQAQKDADTLSILAGVVPVTGPGVRITIKEVGGSVSIEPFIDMVQALRTAGAEAIQVNTSVRLVAQSSFEDATGGILVDGQLLSAPFVVDAIGDPTALAGALQFPGGAEDQFARDDVAELTFQELKALDIEAVRELDQARYATGVPGQ
jgi:uncharacterized protein YlxW (UPF0749 family)